MRLDRKRSLLTLAILTAGWTLAAPALAASVVSIAPTRILFDGRSRVATIYLSNKSDKASTYRISIVNKRMIESGQIVPADSARHDELFASDLLRFSPRRVVIPPRGSQTVRVMLRSPKNGELPPGEYRSHLVFQSVPDVPTVEELDDSDGDLRVRAVAIIETSIPVIVRRGPLDADLRFGRPSLGANPNAPGRPILTVPMERSGDRSVYGVLRVDWFDGQGRSEELAVLSGLAVYTPTPVPRPPASSRAW